MYFQPFKTSVCIYQSFCSEVKRETKDEKETWGWRKFLTHTPHVERDFCKTQRTFGLSHSEY
jgi:hypothetical protein